MSARKKRCNVFLVLLVVLTFTLWECSRKDDEDDNGSDGGWLVDIDDDTAMCSDNIAPELLDVQVIVNGEPRDMPVTIYQGDLLEIAFEYRDADCNLDGGYPEIRGDAQDAPLEWGFDDMACSSEQAGEPYTIAVETGHFINTGSDVYYLLICDHCEYFSNKKYLDITTIPYGSY